MKLKCFLLNLNTARDFLFVGSDLVSKILLRVTCCSQESWLTTFCWTETRILTNWYMSAKWFRFQISFALITTSRFFPWEKPNFWKSILFISLLKASFFHLVWVCKKAMWCFFDVIHLIIQFFLLFPSFEFCVCNVWVADWKATTISSFSFLLHNF